MFIELRPLKKEDALTSYKWRNDPEIWKYTESKPDKLITPEIELEWIERVLQKKDEMRFAILADGKYIGNTYLTNIKDFNAMFHIFIGEKDYWNKGVAKNAMKLIFKIAKNAGLRTLSLKVNKNNKPAYSAYTSVGFNLKSHQGDFLNLIIQLDKLI